MRQDQVGCVRPLNLMDNGYLEGTSAVVFKARILYVTRQAPQGAAVEPTQVEWEGPLVVLKCLMSNVQLRVGQHRSKAYTNMLRRQAADYQVLTGLPPHPNVVEVVHHFVAPALLLRPFVGTAWLEYFSMTRTT